MSKNIYSNVQNLQIHVLIRRAKAWRNGQEWPRDDDGVVQEPNSYLLSLLVIEAYNKVPLGEHKSRKLDYADRYWYTVYVAAQLAIH